MPHTTLVSTGALAARLSDPGWIVFDCRHDLAEPAAGERAYRESHIPGARFLHLDRDLAGPVTGRNGRHPLPDPGVLAEKLGRFGVREQSQAVAYDAHGGMYAARAWWLLRWLGHENVAVLDGGWQRWIAEQRPVSREIPAAMPGTFKPALRDVHLDAHALLGPAGALTFVDARAPDRFRGENETLDPVGGHIPGATNRFFRDNLGAAGTFKPADELRREWRQVLGGAAPSATVHYCGSGVSACHNLLAMEIARLPGSRLYPGSWSEWCSDAARPVERGEPRP
jgi:thiosulfate/3-mercaptopyruvate sulfurtransferase